MAGTPSGWRWRRPPGCCRIWRRCWAGSPATTPAPVYEGDTVYSELHIDSAEPTDDGGLLGLRSLVYAISDANDEPRQVLDWRFTALQF